MNFNDFHLFFFSLIRTTNEPSDLFSGASGHDLDYPNVYMSDLDVEEAENNMNHISSKSSSCDEIMDTMVSN